ncbi:phage adaptor protein [Agrobacterium sp. CG674]
MPKANDILRRASVLLIDDEHARWPLTELADWLNEAVKAIVLAKPSASSRTYPLPLSEGTYQELPITLDGVNPLQLLGINRNLAGDGSTRIGGRAIRTAARALLDAQEPNWHDPAYAPFRKEVRQVIFDENLPLEFYTYPGNDGTGMVEIAISYLPAPVIALADQDETTYEAWDVDIGLPEPYSVPLLDYVLYKAFSKDDIAGDPTKAMSSYQTFAAAVGIKVQAESSANPNRRR